MKTINNYNVKIYTDNIEEKALLQIETLLLQPAFSNCKVRIMPDVHAGAGCVIGFTADLGEKVIPNIVGVDIGCGMLTIDLGNVDIDFEKLDLIIRDTVPSGMTAHEVPIKEFNLEELYCFNHLKNKQNYLIRSIGTLGGGNHFIEVDIDEENNKYLIIHTGSRNLGKQVADYYQKLAIKTMSSNGELNNEKKKEIIRKYKEEGRSSELNKVLKELDNATVDLNIPKELCYLEGEYREQYLHDMRICQEYAKLNRETIANIIITAYVFKPKSSFETIHNYIDLESNIVRKGAISAKKGEQLLIPLNMKDGCIIGIGKGNDDWNESAPHGAGRVLSRIQAKKNLTIDDFKNQMEGIYTTCISNETLDESPMAYKPPQEILDNICETVNVLRIIKPVYNFKASE